MWRENSVYKRMASALYFDKEKKLTKGGMASSTLEMLNRALAS